MTKQRYETARESFDKQIQRHLEKHGYMRIDLKNKSDKQIILWAVGNHGHRPMEFSDCILLPPFTENKPVESNQKNKPRKTRPSIPKD